MRTVRIAAGIAVLVLTAAVARAGSPEFAYLDETDPAKTEKLLTSLLAKYKTPSSCTGLVKLLRGRWPYPKSSKDRETLDFACPDGKTRQFTVLLPSKYTKAKPTGVLIWLHGAIRQPAPGGGAGEAQMFAPAVEDLGLIVVGPSTFDGVEWGDPACRALVLHALDYVKTHHNVDENRVWIAGDSDGGRGTYAITETFANFFGAAVPVIGAPGGVTRFLNFRNLPWFAINGGKDSIFTIDHVREAVDGMKAAGIHLEWKLVENGAHDPRFFLTYKAEVQAFLKAHPRDPYPKTVEWCVDPSRKDHDGGFPGNTFRWIRIEEAGDSESNATFDDESGLLRGGLPRVLATYDGNRVMLRTRGVKRVTVLVSDQMLDLKKEITVEVNDKVLFRGKVEPDPRAILEEARLFKDRALVFSNRITLDVDAAEVPAEAAEPKDG
jgi:hypothetical protein